QWTPLLMCAAFFPLASAFMLAKPHIGAPVALTNISRKGLIATAIFLLVSLALRPHWPMDWIAQIGGYQYFVPVLVLPGPLLLVALRYGRERDARLLLLSCLLPQRWFYDSFILWLIPKTRRSIVMTVGCSWIVGVWRWYHGPTTVLQV